MLENNDSLHLVVLLILLSFLFAAHRQFLGYEKLSGIVGSEFYRTDRAFPVAKTR